MKHVLFKAPVMTSSGYGVHARQVARALFEYVDNNKITLSVAPTMWGTTPWLLRDDMHNGLIGKIKKHCTNLDKRPDVTVQLLLPNEWIPVEGAVNIGLTAGVETDKLNPLWINNVNAMDAVIVPSTHVFNTFKASGIVTKSMYVVPESFIDALKIDNQQVFNFETSFNFLVVGQFTSDRQNLDRKNIINTIRIISETFRNDPDVGIVVKLNAGRSTLIDRKITVDKIKQLLKQVRKGNFPRVYIVHGDLTDNEMAALYTNSSIKALVTLTRGEGFGLPILEAAAAGLPVIATNWSGHLDFMNRGNFIKVNYGLEKIPDERVDHHSDSTRNIWIDGAMWAQPREQNAVQALKKFRISPDVPLQWAIDLSHIIKAEFNSDVVTSQYRSIFNGVL